MIRVVTGVGIEPTTYGLKERRSSVTPGAVESNTATVRAYRETLKYPEPRPNGCAVCDGMCVLGWRCLGASA